MNTKEVLEAVRTALRAATWTGGAKVFAAESVFVTAAAPEIAYETIRCPQVHLGVGGNQADPDSTPKLISQEILVRIVVKSAADGRGEAAIMGANRQTNSSLGAGLLDVEEKVMNAIALMAGSGVNVLFRASSAQQAAKMNDTEYVVIRDYNFTTRISTIRSDS